jgi:hypothetical protein
MTMKRRVSSHLGRGRKGRKKRRGKGVLGGRLGKRIAKLRRLEAINSLRKCQKVCKVRFSQEGNLLRKSCHLHHLIPLIITQDLLRHLDQVKMICLLSRVIAQGNLKVLNHGKTKKY